MGKETWNSVPAFLITCNGKAKIPFGEQAHAAGPPLTLGRELQPEQRRLALAIKIETYTFNKVHFLKV